MGGGGRSCPARTDSFLGRCEGICLGRREPTEGSDRPWAHTVTAELVFSQDGDLVDFVSDDRLRSSSDGKTFTRQRWSTPVRDYRTFGSRRVCTNGEGRWHAPAPEGNFAYLDFSLDGITYNASNARTKAWVPATASPQVRDQRPSPAHSVAR